MPELLASLERIEPLLDGVWRASWQAAVLALLVLAIQLILRERLSARWRYRLWMLVLIRLALPVTPPSPMSLYNLAPKLEAVPLAVAEKSDTANRARWNAEETVLMFAPPGVHPAELAPWNWRHLAVAAWMIGAALLALRLVWISLALWRRVRRLVPVDDLPLTDIVAQCAAEMRTRPPRIFAAGDLPSPALVGWLRPRLLLPEHVIRDFDRAELRLIVLHELAHLKRRDVAAAWLVAVLQILHWFNPVAWLVMRRLARERELACDEMVLATVPEPEQRVYGRTILRLLETLPRRSPLPGVVGIVEDGSFIKRRITMIARFSSNRRRWTTVALCMSLLLACVALTDATADQPPAEHAPAEPQPEPAAQTETPAPAEVPRSVTPPQQVTPPGHAPRPTRGYGTFDMDAAEMMGSGDGMNPYSMAMAAPHIDQEVLQALDRQLPEVRFDNVALADVIDFLRETTELNIAVDWNRLEAGGIDRNHPIALRLRKVPVSEALSLMLRDLGGDRAHVMWTAQGRTVIITAAVPPPRPSTRVYDVAHLLGGGLSEQDPRKQVQELRVVVASVAREQDATVATYGTKIIVTASQRVHDDVAQILKSLQQPEKVGQ